MNPRELRRLVFDFRAARAVMAGAELGIYEALGHAPRRARELAASLGLELRGLCVLLRALDAVGVLESVAGGYRLAPELRDSLLEGGESYFGHLLRHDLWHWTSWAALDESVRSARPHTDRAGDRHLGAPEVLRRFLPNYHRAMEESAGGAAERLARAISRRGARALLDLGGGTGDLLTAWLRLEPNGRATLVDRASAIERAHDRLSTVGVLERATLLELDLATDTLPTGHDAIVLSRMLMGLTPERAQQLVERAANALSPGGCVYVHDFDSEERVGALLSLDMLLHTGGECHLGSTLEAWLGKAGLELCESRSLLPYTRLWVGRKPC